MMMFLLQRGPVEPKFQV